MATRRSARSVPKSSVSSVGRAPLRDVPPNRLSVTPVAPKKRGVKTMKTTPRRRRSRPSPALKDDGFDLEFPSSDVESGSDAEQLKSIPTSPPTPAPKTKAKLSSNQPKTTAKTKSSVAAARRKRGTPASSTPSPAASPELDFDGFSSSDEDGDSDVDEAVVRPRTKAKPTTKTHPKAKAKAKANAKAKSQAKTKPKAKAEAKPVTTTPRSAQRPARTPLSAVRQPSERRRLSVKTTPLVSPAMTAAAAEAALTPPTAAATPVINERQPRRRSTRSSAPAVATPVPHRARLSAAPIDSITPIPSNKQDRTPALAELSFELDATPSNTPHRLSFPALRDRTFSDDPSDDEAADEAAGAGAGVSTGAFDDDDLDSPAVDHSPAVDLSPLSSSYATPPSGMESPDKTHVPRENAGRRRTSKSGRRSSAVRRTSKSGGRRKSSVGTAISKKRQSSASAVNKSVQFEPDLEFDSDSASESDAAAVAVPAGAGAGAGTSDRRRSKRPRARPSVVARAQMDWAEDPWVAHLVGHFKEVDAFELSFQ